MGLYLDDGLMVLNKITSQKTGFIKTTDHRPTDPPTTFHLPTNTPTTYPPTHGSVVINLH